MLDIVLAMCTYNQKGDFEEERASSSVLDIKAKKSTQNLSTIQLAGILPRPQSIPEVLDLL